MKEWTYKSFSNKVNNIGNALIKAAIVDKRAEFWSSSVLYQNIEEYNIDIFGYNFYMLVDMSHGWNIDKWGAPTAWNILYIRRV